MATIIVGGVLKKDNKYLLVQEAKKKCFGKWNIPAGHLEFNESVFDGAKREVLEECGYQVELKGIAHIENKFYDNDNYIVIIFSTEITGGSISYNKNEILDVKWFTYEEIKSMKNELRDYNMITYAITNVENNKVSDIDIIKATDKNNS